MLSLWMLLYGRERFLGHGYSSEERDLKGCILLCYILLIGKNSVRLVLCLKEFLLGKFKFFSWSGVWLGEVFVLALLIAYGETWCYSVLRCCLSLIFLEGGDLYSVAVLPLLLAELPQLLPLSVSTSFPSPLFFVNSFHLQFSKSS